ncbi:hypothetical protein SAMN05421630_110203 [Prauserella marina]|uniref:Uncharacterized protein n=1 Tax=Prauserella marina TaxID=530584 RepID=A0A1G6W7P2_9PSEU|nr:hypothetical protein [Prauserella marina]PWV74028.1 hypothetical protein DES30_108202 [Prauserella marina]SDD61247.1 hypothetical protein SAMN05421630_110203 [Prauserella marina]
MIFRRMRRCRSFTRRQWEDLIDVLDEVDMVSRGTLEYLQRRGRGILEVALGRLWSSSSSGQPPNEAEQRLRREAYEAVGYLSAYLEDADRDPYDINQIGTEVSAIGERLACFPREPDPAPPSHNVEVQLRRINRAVDAEAHMIYALMNTNLNEARDYLRRRGFHLLELGMIEAEQAGIDITDLRAEISAAFGVPDPGT